MISFQAVQPWTTAAQGSNILFYVTNANTSGSYEAMRLDYTGNLGLGVVGPAYQVSLSRDSAAKPATGTWTIASDERLKRSVRPLEGGLSVIRQLQAIEAEYNGEDGTPDGLRVVSFAADKVRAIVPHAVTSHKGRLAGVAADVLDLNIHEILMHLVVAVQQLDAGRAA
jgi:hypothetical protein